jgi:uncharacterized lipoprotein YajG
MQFKPIAVMILLSLVVDSLLVAGCTTPTDNTATNQTPSASTTTSTTTHDSFLEKYLAEYKNNWYADKNTNNCEWELK